MFYCKTFQVRSLIMILISIFCLFVTNWGICATVSPEIGKILQKAIDESRESAGIIGVTASVILPGHGIWVGASGLAEKKSGKAMVPDNLIGIASITKTFTATTVLQLVEEGVLSLDDTVDKWLPGVLPNGKNINIRQLLGHTSGIPEYTNIIFPKVLNELNKFWKPEEIIALVRDLPLDFEPGTTGKYSNTGYIILGMIIEKSTNSIFSDEVRQRFIAPLKLDKTFMGAYENIPEGELAIGYSASIPDNIMEQKNPNLLSGLWAAGGMVSTAENIALWIRALMTGSVLSQESLDEMLNLHQVDFYQYGLGIMAYPSNIGMRYGHTGGVPGATSRMFYFPDKDVAISIISNQDMKNIDVIFNAIVDKVPELLKIPIPTQTTSVKYKTGLVTTWGNLKG